jgi:hypothetical protein
MDAECRRQLRSRGASSRVNSFLEWRPIGSTTKAARFGLRGCQQNFRLLIGAMAASEIDCEHGFASGVLR